MVDPIQTPEPTAALVIPAEVAALFERVEAKLAERPAPTRAVKCHTVARAGDNADRTEVERLLDGLGPDGSTTADDFFARLRKASTPAPAEADSIRSFAQIAKASRQLDDAIDGELYGSGVGVAARAIEPPVDFVELSRFLTEDVYHARCVNLAATVASGPGWTIEPAVKGADPKTLDSRERDRLSAFFKRVNPLGQTLLTLARLVFTDSGSIGNGFVEIVRARAGTPAEMYHVPGVSVRLDRRGLGFWQVGVIGGTWGARFFKRWGDPVAYNNRTGEPFAVGEERTEDTTAGELIHFATYHPASRYYGIPWWFPALVQVASNIAAARWNAQFFEFNTVPRKIIAFTGGVISPEVEREIEDYFTTVAKGRNHKALVLAVDDPDAKLVVENLESTAPEAGFLELRKANRDEIVSAHGTPPGMVGIEKGGRLGKGDTESGRRDYKTFVIEPMQTGFEEIINALIVGEGFGVTGWALKLADFDLSDQEATLAKSREMRSDVGMGLRTINEARIEMGLQPYDPAEVPAAGRPFVNTSSGPLFLDTIGEGVAPTAAPDGTTQAAAEGRTSGQAGRPVALSIPPEVAELAAMLERLEARLEDVEAATLERA